MVIQVSLEDINKINDFVDNSINTHISYYKKRNQEDIEKIKSDIYNGKLSEFAVYNLYKDKFSISYPDINVYTNGKKSFDADFIIGNNIHLHVKSQHINLSKRFGLSWSFQVEDSLTKTPSENDYVIFTIIEDFNKVRIVKKVKASKLLQFYKDPVLEKLKGIKKVIYFEDIKNI